MTHAPSAPTPIDPDERRAIAVAPWVSLVILLLAIVLGAFALYTAGVRPLNLFYQRGFHLLPILLIAFLAFPIGRRRLGALGWLVDLPFLAGPSTVAAT